MRLENGWNERRLCPAIHAEYLLHEADGGYAAQTDELGCMPMTVGYRDRTGPNAAPGAAERGLDTMIQNHPDLSGGKCKPRLVGRRERPSNAPETGRHRAG